MDPQPIITTAEHIRREIHKVVKGQTHAINLLLVALLAEGHVLLEGVPGTAKTLLVRALAGALGQEFGRIQFTPDLMPGDVLGTNLFDFHTQSFHLRKGPIFTQLLLADEINRTPPKTQAALLQAMQERIVTIDGTTHELPEGFLVVATQNPIEQEGTYPLPEAQLDRFLFKVPIGYPTEEQERALVGLHGRRTLSPRIADFGVEPVVDASFFRTARSATEQCVLSDELVDYVVTLTRATRKHPSLTCGASPRAASALATAARCFAALSGRDYVLPDDVKKLAKPALAHRLQLSPGAEIEGRTASDVLSEVIEKVPVPK